VGQKEVFRVGRAETLWDKRRCLELGEQRNCGTKKKFIMGKEEILGQKEVFRVGRAEILGDKRRSSELGDQIY
jgi:hypothetical protein